MSDNKSGKSFIDSMFDIADQALSPLEAALTQAPAPEKQTPPMAKPGNKPIIDVQPDHSEEWEKQFEVIQWASVDGGTWHAFKEGTMRTLCNFDRDYDTTYNRGVLDHKKVIAACTSCIIAVSK